MHSLHIILITLMCKLLTHTHTHTHTHTPYVHNNNYSAMKHKHIKAVSNRVQTSTKTLYRKNHYGNSMRKVCDTSEIFIATNVLHNVYDG